MLGDNSLKIIIAIQFSLIKRYEEFDKCSIYYYSTLFPDSRSISKKQTIQTKAVHIKKDNYANTSTSVAAADLLKRGSSFSA